MTGKEREALIAAATTAWRARDADGTVRAHHAWHDLDDAGRAAAFDETARLRALEAAADPTGLSTTARAILSRIRRA